MAFIFFVVAMKPRSVLVFLQRVLPRRYESCVPRGGLSNKAHDKIRAEPAALEVRHEFRQELLRGHGPPAPIHEDPTANAFERIHSVREIFVSRSQAALRRARAELLIAGASLHCRGLMHDRP